MPEVYHNLVALTGRLSGAVGIALPVAGQYPAAKAVVMRAIDPLCCDPVDAGMHVTINIYMAAFRVALHDN